MNEELIRKLDELWKTSGGNSGGRKWTREELYERSPTTTRERIEAPGFARGKRKARR